MRYDFDEIIDRRGTGDVKHCLLEEYFGRPDLLPLWVADMDFATPPFILDAMRRRLEHPILGYTVLPEGYWETVAGWVESHYGWHVETEWMRYIPGIVKGIGLVVNVFTKPSAETEISRAMPRQGRGRMGSNVFTKPSDSVIIQPPVYHPFRITPEGNGRRIVWNPLLPAEGETAYAMDFEGLERVCDDRCRLLILSNPQNPTGICWDRVSLERLARFCHERGIVVVSDEIHCDMALFGHRHIPFASVSPEAAACSITFQAPSKTFNMAGMVSSYCIIPNPELRQRFFGWLDANEFDAPHLLAPIATMAAYREGEEWRRQLVAYIEENVRYVETFCRERLPMLRPLRPQASFLVWLDCRALGLSQERLVSLFVNQARLALNDGSMFGPGGEGFMRMNVGCPRSVLREAMERMQCIVNS